MSTRLQISDKKNNLLTIRLSQAFDFSPTHGTWMPDSPGKVRSRRDWDNNPWDGVASDDDGSFTDAVCYTMDANEVRIAVMRFFGALQSGVREFLSKGSGYLYKSGNLTMAEGIFTWTNLDAVLSDSADDSSDDDSDGSDDSSDVSDSAYA